MLAPAGADLVLYLAPQSRYVNLGFFFGAGVTDPLGLLESSGKRMRQVKIRTVQAVQNPALIPIVHEAWDHGVKAYAHLHETRGKRRERVVERQALQRGFEGVA